MSDRTSRAHRISRTQASVPTLPVHVHDLMEQAAAPLLDTRHRVLMHPGDPVGGGPHCSVSGCPRIARTCARCFIHYQRWRGAGSPPDGDWDPGPPPGPDYLSLHALPPPLRSELAYGILQARQHGTDTAISLHTLNRLVSRLKHSAITSLLQHPESAWPATATLHSRQASPSRQRHATPIDELVRLQTPFLLFCIDQIDLARGATREDEYRRDVWRLRRLGFPTNRGGMMIDLTRIETPWLRGAVKRFLRWRIDTGHSQSGIHRDCTVLTTIAEVLLAHAGPDATPTDFDRTVISKTLTRMAADGYSANGRGQRLSTVRAFLAACRQHDWIPDLPTQTAVYSEDIPPKTALLPRALPDMIMAQLEHPDNLAQLDDPRWALLFPMLIDTGLRINDALNIPAHDCVVRDHHGAPYLRYTNRKMKREALVPISTSMAAAITDHAQRLLDTYPPGPVMLFPRTQANPTGTIPAVPGTARRILDEWITACRIVDEFGIPAHITLHQFRHTLGTRLINHVVPQEVVRKILDHSSAEMTAHYARLHDDTVRQHWERARKVNIHGESIDTPDDHLADAAWMKHHLATATQALPNGYCGLPLQQSCPHANACLTCPVFITTDEFLPQHKEQLALTQGIIKRAEQRGQLRLIEMNTQTADNLTAIIDSLENLCPTDEPSE
ncbi:site-specific integrase [Gordonia sp. ABSL11-1]|uniref:tyrosine-type recombinase/integrase n=1 Tax=Gordonia sp. ABSL11-1 TaxID=3053924 RepID=UPI0025746D4D|nr:site-specific integrase [Gordonia sp. ABSL11-1]MDL9947569.1 site-specific integrase [Gordonia sp. ABSL11-1]